MSRNEEKAGTLHPRNPHAGRYDFAALCGACPELSSHLRPNPAGDETIDFADAEAVLCLNRALLAHTYEVKHWEIPKGYLCPPIPGRADMIHYLADLLARRSGGKVPTGKSVKVLDIGTGANCIYPIIGSQSYGWKFVGTEIDPVAIKTARAIVAANPRLTKSIKIVEQSDPAAIFRGVIARESYDLVMSNPPFHASIAEAQAGTRRKSKNLSKGRRTSAGTALNFGGQNAELWCPGGEVRFITQMIEESQLYPTQVSWFSSLVSKRANLPALKRAIGKTEARTVEVIEMSQRNKQSRILAWSYQA